MKKIVLFGIILILSTSILVATGFQINNVKNQSEQDYQNLSDKSVEFVKDDKESKNNIEDDYKEININDKEVKLGRRRFRFFHEADIDSQGEEVKRLRTPTDRPYWYFSCEYKQISKPIIISGTIRRKEVVFHCEKFWAHDVVGWVYPILEDATGIGVLAIGRDVK